MTKHEVAALACKILGIYFIVGALSGFGYAVTMMVEHFSGMREGEIGNLWLAALVGSGLMMVFGILLWFLADRVAARMVPERGSLAVESRTTGADIQAIAFSVVGVFVLARFFPRLTQLIVNLSVLADYDRAQLDARTKAMIGELIVQLAIGLWLLFGSRGIVGLLKTARGVGIGGSGDAAE